MSKHDLITKNLRALTNTRSFRNAVRGWAVKRMIVLGSGPAQACELCGTRFRNGAHIQHTKTAAAIVVGGTCFRTILLSHFPPGCDIKAQRRDIRRKLETTYEGLIDPGNWIKWIVENAPPRLAHSAADLRHFAVLSSPDDLDRLIRFHDARRQFRRAALLSNIRSLEMVLKVKIPAHITIDQAKKYEAKLAAKPKRLKVPLIATEYASESVHPFIVGDPALNAVWKNLEPQERRAVAALAALDEKASPPDLPLCPDALALQWPTPTGTSLFVWHPKIGLGFVGETDHLDGEKAYVWLWRSGSYQRCKYNLQYWRGVKGCSEEAVQALEQNAFAR